MLFLIPLLSLNLFATGGIGANDPASSRDAAIGASASEEGKSDDGAARQAENIAREREDREQERREDEARDSARATIDLLRRAHPDQSAAIADEIRNQLGLPKEGADSGDQAKLVFDDKADEPAVFRHLDRSSRLARWINWTGRNRLIPARSWVRLGETCQALMRRGFLTAEDCDPNRVYLGVSELTGKRLLILEDMSGRPFFFTDRGRRMTIPETRGLFFRTIGGKLKDRIGLSDKRTLVVEQVPDERSWLRRLGAGIRDQVVPTGRPSHFHDEDIVWGFADRPDRFSMIHYPDYNTLVSRTSCADHTRGWMWPEP